MKDTFFFTHDFGARNDPKLQNILMEYGCEGLGVFWCIVEMVYEQEGTLPLSNCKSIAFALHVECKVVESIINDFNLFKNDGVNFWSESINNRLNKRVEIAEKRKKAAASSWESRRVKQMQSKNNANAMDCNAIKEKERKENNNESNKLDSPENEFSGDSDSDSSIEDTDTQTEQEKPPQGKKEGKKIDFKAIIEMYHANCPSFPRIIKLSDARKQKVKSRLAEMKDDWALLESVFTTMESSKFLRGDNKNGWKATFDWIFDNEKNWLKVIEGNYNDKSPSGGNSKNVNDIWNSQ
jgi:uncharacterized protein YdaU (DUF1376 family)